MSISSLFLEFINEEFFDKTKTNLATQYSTGFCLSVSHLLETQVVSWGTIKHWTQNSRKSNLQACIHTQNIWKGRALMKQRMEKAKTIRFLYKAYSMRQGYNKCNIHRNKKKKVRTILTKKCSKNTKLVQQFCKWHVHIWKFN